MYKGVNILLWVFWFSGWWFSHRFIGDLSLALWTGQYIYNLYLFGLSAIPYIKICSKMHLIISVALGGGSSSGAMCVCVWVTYCMLTYGIVLPGDCVCIYCIKSCLVSFNVRFSLVQTTHHHHHHHPSIPPPPRITSKNNVLFRKNLYRKLITN